MVVATFGNWMDKLVVMKSSIEILEDWLFACIGISTTTLGTSMGNKWTVVIVDTS